MDVTEATFGSAVLERSAELPVVVDFWADWCGPCKALAPVLEHEVEARSGRIALVKVDVDAEQGLARTYGIQGIPAVKAFRNGRVVSEFVGVQSPQGVARFLDELLGPSPAEALLAELQGTGEFPEILGPLAEGDLERALEWLINEVAAADAERKNRIRQVMVAIFNELGSDHPVAMHYRRRLASALY
jgi:putative thioredoxin